MVVVETDTDEGTKPKTSILRGLADESAYSRMLSGVSSSGGRRIKPNGPLAAGK